MRDPIATALRTAKGYGQRYAEGGDVDPEALAFEPGESWTPPPEPLEAGYPEPQAPAPNKIRDNIAALSRQTRGTPVPAPLPAGGQSLTEYHPTAAENIGAAIAGEHGERRHLAEGLVGQAGLGTTGGLLGWTPVGQALQFQEAGQHGNAQEAALAIMPGAKNASGVAKRAAKGLLDLPAGSTESWLKEPHSQLGSNPGSMYHDPSGQSWYIKTPQTEDHAKNEKLAAELYKLAGVPVADVHLTEVGGKTAVASPIIPGKTLNKHGPEQYGDIEHLQGGFPADAWLANYDSVGTGKDNVVVNNGVAHRIDMGGALRYRAQGKPKEFGPKVGEFDSMTIPGHNGINNKDATDVFGQKLTPEVMDARQETAQRIADIPKEKIANLVNKYGPENISDRTKLYNNIIKRQQQVADHYGLHPTADVEAAISSNNVVPLNAPQAKPQMPASPKAIADALITNFGHHIDPAHDISEAIWKIAEKHGHQNADSVVAHLPGELAPDIDNYLAAKEHHVGYSPWPQMAEAPPVNEPVQKIKPTPGLMQINKTHDLSQVIHSIKKQAMPTLGDNSVTPKQIGKISDILLSKNPKQIAETMMDAQLTSKQADNVLSWLNPFVKKQVDDHYDALLGGGLKPEEMFEKTFKQGINANKPHWFGNFQKNYEKFYQSLKTFYKLSEKSPAQREADRIAGGFTTPAYSGIRPEHGNLDPFHESSQFHSNMVDVAHAYSVYKNEAAHSKWWDLNHPGVLSEYEHAAIQPLWLDTREYVTVDADGRSFQTGNDMAWDARKSYFDKYGKEAKGAIINNVHDMPMGGHTGGYEHPSGNPFTVYQSWDPSTRRSKWARFDKNRFGKTGLHLSLAGGMIGGMGLAGSKGNGILINPNDQQEGYARGGAVKVAKASVNYSKGMQERHCGICQFYQDKTCSKVQGPIDWSFWCRLYKAKE